MIKKNSSKMIIMLKIIRSIHILLTIFLLFNTKIYSQQVVGSAGMSYENQNVNLSWTLGEVAIMTLENQNQMLTQGFHQPILVVLNSDDVTTFDKTIKVFPNPTSDYVILQVDNEINQSMFYRLYDFAGQLIQFDIITSELTNINFEFLPAGVYLITINDSIRQLKSFRIIKTP